MYKFDNNNEGEAETAQSAMSSLTEASKDIMSVIVRLSGLMLLFIGLWVAVQVFSEALALYKDPANIERIAISIEAGSNIDKSIAPLRDSLLGESAEDLGTKTETNSNGIRISYFIAWVIDLLLLLLLARISLMAIKTGGELALYDTQIRRFARQLVRENQKE